MQSKADKRIKHVYKRSDSRFLSSCKAGRGGNSTGFLGMTTLGGGGGVGSLGVGGGVGSLGGGGVGSLGGGGVGSFGGGGVGVLGGGGSAFPIIIFGKIHRGDMLFSPHYYFYHHLCCCCHWNF